MTADSTISVSHFHGARSVPSTMADSSSACGSEIRRRDRRVRVIVATRCSILVPAAGGASARRPPAARIPARAALRPGAALARATGTRRSGALTAFRTAQARMARNARPAGCGRRVPRSNQRGHRRRACKRVLEQTDVALRARGGTRPSRRTARRVRASCTIRRAISTHSRPSPGAEKKRTSPPARARAAGCGRRDSGAARRDRVSSLCSSRFGWRPSAGEPRRAWRYRRRARSAECSASARDSASRPRSARGRTRTRRPSRSARRAAAVALDRIGGRGPRHVSPPAAASNSVARSVALAPRRTARRTARAAPRDRAAERQPCCSRSAPTPASRSSCSVRASARGKPGVCGDRARSSRARRRAAPRTWRAPRRLQIRDTSRARAPGWQGPAPRDARRAGSG